ncbi:SURF1 family protein [Streptomyces sp. NPDC006529]|uniref:SURF1 family cytochrome oxidase biogenesis protein n=1 Tax=Streptomyces sp. NPDC006529 TaxID=3157177 RepID=UPI0033BAE64A
MYRFVLTRQWLGLHLLALVLIPSMIQLGFWQFHRHEHRVAQNELIAANLAAEPAPMTALTSPGHVVPRADFWRAVTATGTYDPAHEVVVRMRTSNDGKVGFQVVTPLVLGDGRVVLVNRGWVPGGGDPRAYPAVPAAPAGQVTVTGRLKADEVEGDGGITDRKGLPDRQVMLVNSAQQARYLGKPVLGGYLELTGPVPPGGSPQPVGEPDHDSIGPHMAYAVQWWLFTAAVPVGWVILVRREKRDREEAAAKAAAGAEGDGGGAGPGGSAEPEHATA